MSPNDTPGDQINAQGSQGFVNKPSGPVTQHFHLPTPKQRRHQLRASPWIRGAIDVLKHICAAAFVFATITGVMASVVWLLVTSGRFSESPISDNVYDLRIYLVGLLAGGVGWWGFSKLNERLVKIAEVTDVPRRIRSPDEMFTGCEQEIKSILTYLEGRKKQRAAVIIRGMGGVGKTQLAYAVVRKARHKGLYPDGDLEIALEGMQRPLDIEQALQQLLYELAPAMAQFRTGNIAGIYADRLRNQQMLLLADNAKDAKHVSDLLPPEQSALLITTRNHFELRNIEPYICELRTLPEADACKLLRRNCPRIGDNAPELARLCGYLPLALRISVDLLETDKTRPVAGYLEQLRAERLRHLADPDNPDDPAASVEASLALSYAALPVDAQTTFMQLGVFVGDFTREALKRVVDGVADVDKAAGLLYRRSLLEYNGVTDRFNLHDLVHDYALARLAESGDECPTRLRHARYYANVAYHADKELYLKGKPLEGLALFDRERQQIDAGWQWAMEEAKRRGHEDAKASQPTPAAHPSNPDIDMLLLNFANATVYMGELRYDLRRERIPQFAAQLDAARRLGRKDNEGWALGNLGNAYARLGDYSTAIECHQQALVISREAGDRQGEGAHLGNLGNAYHNLGDYRKAIDCYEQHRVIAREFGDRHEEGNALGNLGNAYVDLGDYSTAIEFYKQRLAFAREIGDLQREGNALGGLGIAYCFLGNYSKAIEYHEQDLAIRHRIGDRGGAGNALGNLGQAYKDLGEYSTAIEFYKQQLDIASEINDRRGQGNALGGLGNAYHNLRDYRKAVEFYEQALKNDQEIGNQGGVAHRRWKLGLLYEQQGDLAKAVELMQAAVNFYTSINHAQYAEVANNGLARVQAKLREQS